MNNKKGQAAMEFLMTYGWAIIVVLAAIGALAYFGVLSPSNLLPARTTFQAPIPNVDVAVINAGTAGNGLITVAFRNNVGSTINVTDITNATGDCGAVGGTEQIAIGTGTAVDINTGQLVQNGEAFRVSLTCASLMTAGERFASDITFEYINTDSGLTRPHKGSVEGEIV